MITPIAYTDPRFADSDPNGNTDYTNKFCKELWNDWFRTEHDKDGDHMADFLASLDKFEIGTYSGNGTSQTVSLTDSTLDISVVKIWSENVEYHYFCSSNMTADNTARSYSGEAWQSSQITSVATTGEFDVGSDSDVNANTITYYYICFGS